MKQPGVEPMSPALQVDTAGRSASNLALEQQGAILDSYYYMQTCIHASYIV